MWTKLLWQRIEASTYPNAWTEHFLCRFFHCKPFMHLTPSPTATQQNVNMPRHYSSLMQNCCGSCNLTVQYIERQSMLIKFLPSEAELVIWVKSWMKQQETHIPRSRLGWARIGICQARWLWQVKHEKEEAEDNS